jgi:hypothetical protein
MSNPNSTEGFRELIHDAIDSTTTTVQSIHQAIANAPFDALAEADGLEWLVRDLHETQDRVVSTVYDAVRKVNREIQQVGDDLLG